MAMAFALGRRKNAANLHSFSSLPKNAIRLYQTYKEDFQIGSCCFSFETTPPNQFDDSGAGGGAGVVLTMRDTLQSMLRTTAEEQVSKVLSTASLVNPCGTVLDSFPRIIVDYQGKRDNFCARRGSGGTRIIRFYHDVQVMARLLRCSEQQDIDVLAANATSAGEFKENIFKSCKVELPCCDIDLIYACTRDKTLMVDVQAQEVTEEDLEVALRLAHQEAVKYIDPQIKLAEQAGKCKKDYKFSMLVKDSTVRKIESLAEAPFEAAYGNAKGIRLDGRRFDEVRRVECESGRMSGLQGSSCFACGATKVSCTVTQTRPETYEAETQDGFVPEEHLYFRNTTNYPRYLYKTRPFRIDGDWKKCGHIRCEAEDSSFLENAFVAVLPKEDTFPYVVRCNCSASTASVCGVSIALMDAGVPQRKHVAGVSMGIAREVHFSSTVHGCRYRILTDLSSSEEQLGDMNLKVAGSWEGITAVQLDLNVAGVPSDIICKCLGPALKARLQILDRMEQEISVPRYCVSNDWYWPYPIVAKYFLPAQSVDLLFNVDEEWYRFNRYGDRFERYTGSRITSIEEGGEITVVAMDKASHIQVLRKVKDMDGIESEVDYSEYYDDFDAAREFFDSDDSFSDWFNNCSPEVEEPDPLDGLESYDDSDGSQFYNVKEWLTE
ncbi:hypothetical protein MKW92_045871 [Papaver armeniacum]|nr:hypothetical protein MKW92_045871 [Papaver armeniacum]